MDFDEAVDEEGNFTQDDWLVKATNRFNKIKDNVNKAKINPENASIGSKNQKKVNGSTSGYTINNIVSDIPIKDPHKSSALFERKSRKFCQSNILDHMSAVQLDPRGHGHLEVHQKNWALCKTYNLTDLQAIVVCLQCVGLMGVAIAPLVQISAHSLYKYISTIRNKLGYDKSMYYTTYDYMMKLKSIGFAIIRKQYTHGVQRTLKSQMFPEKTETQMDEVPEAPIEDASPEPIDYNEVEGGYDDEEADI